MKATDNFKKVISAHLEQLAATDQLFAETFKKPNKSIDECINFILSEVKKSGQQAWSDDEVYSLAVHYYDEDDIKNIKPVQVGKIITPYVPELTEEEKQAIKQEAIDKLVKEEAERLKAKKPAPKKEEAKTVEPTLSLFD